MNTVRTFLKNADVKKIGVVSFYAYFAINILMKAFSYDHGDNIYKWFFYTAILFWGIKMVFTTYTMWEVFWITVMMGIGVMLSVITRQNMWLLSIMTVVPFFGDCTDRSLDPLCGGGDTVRWFPDRNF